MVVVVVVVVGVLLDSAAGVAVAGVVVARVAVALVVAAEGVDLTRLREGVEDTGFPTDVATIVSGVWKR